MRTLKSHPLLRLVNSYIIDASQPSNISYLWNFGSLLALCLIIQIITGVTLAMHYNPSVLEAFNSVEHIMRDVNNGWLIRYLHSNTASAFFLLVYLHIGRGLYYGSYRSPRTLVWTIGTVIFLTMMATAFLGYYHSPKWFGLDLYTITYTLLTYIFSINLLILYLDNFKLSSFIVIKYLKIFTIILILILIILDSAYFIDTINCINDKDNGVNIHGHINMTKEAAESISQSITTVGSNLGLGATIAGVGTAVGKSVAKSAMPPLQKAGIIVGGALTAGFGHSIITTVNRNQVKLENLSNPDNVSNLSSNINKLLDDSSTWSPLETLLFDIKGLNTICLGLIIILVIQIIFKFYIKDKVILNFSNKLGVTINNKLEYYINKIIMLNKKMSIIYIWVIIFILLCALSFSIYASDELFNNLDNYITVHNNIKNK